MSDRPDPADRAIRPKTSSEIIRERDEARAEVVSLRAELAVARETGDGLYLAFKNQHAAREAAERERDRLTQNIIDCNARSRVLADKLVAAERERDEYRKALKDEIDNWNPEARPTITARAEAAEAENVRLREALERIVAPRLPGQHAVRTARSPVPRSAREQRHRSRP